MSAALYAITYSETLAADTSNSIVIDSASRGFWIGGTGTPPALRARWQTSEMRDTGIPMPTEYGFVLPIASIWVPGEIRELEIRNFDPLVSADYIVTVVV